MKQELELKTMKEIDIEALASMYDEDSKDLYVSLFIDVTKDSRRFFDKRSEDIKRALKPQKELFNNFVETIEMLKENLGYEPPKGARSLVLFASKAHNYFEGFYLPLPVEDLMVVDTSPYIRDLSLLKDEYQDYMLAVVDSEHFKVYCVSSTTIICEEHRETDLIGKHKKGGWSQKRFARLRREGVDKFMKLSSEDLKELYDNEKYSGIVVAGPGIEKSNFVKQLPQELREKVVSEIDVSFDTSVTSLIDKSAAIMQEMEDAEEMQLVELLREGIIKGNPVIYGLEETLEAVKNARASILLVDMGYKVPGYICENCQLVEKGQLKKCSVCGGVTSDVDVVEEIIEFAHRVDTKVEFVKGNDFLKSLGGIGALLRY